jgi:hypothetical protein
LKNKFGFINVNKLSTGLAPVTMNFSMLKEKIPGGLISSLQAMVAPGWRSRITNLQAISGP